MAAMQRQSKIVLGKGQMIVSGVIDQMRGAVVVVLFRLDARVDCGHCGAGGCVGRCPGAVDGQAVRVGRSVLVVVGMDLGDSVTGLDAGDADCDSVFVSIHREYG